MQVRFYSRPLTSGQLKIYAEYNHQGKWRFPTKVICNPSSWHPGKQIIKQPRGKGVSAFDTQLVIKQNTQLGLIREKLFLLAKDILADGFEPTPDRVRLAYMGEGKVLSFWPGFDEYMRTVVVPPDHSIHSQKKYRSVFNFIRRYEKFTGKPITFESMGKTWDRKFRQYLRDQHDNSRETQTGKITKLKAYLEYAYSEGWHKNESFRGWKSSFSPGSAEIVLTMNELLRIAQLDLDPTYEKIRDICLGYVTTGLRYEKAQTIGPDTLQGNKFIFYNEKGKKNQYLPIARIPLSIINKYRGFPQYANQPLNRMVKQLCKMAEINEPHMYRGKVRPKHECISCQNFRQSFTSILMRAKVDFAEREYLVGHSLPGHASHYHNFEHEHLLSEIERAFQPLTDAYIKIGQD